MKTRTAKQNIPALPAKRLGIAYFIAAAIFLFNPQVNIVDLLPDFFGYIFLMSALSKWADLCPNISDAMENLSKLRWFSLIKMAAMILVPFCVDTDVLVLTFVFVTIEYIFFIPSIGRIFDGFEYFGTRFSGRSIFVDLKNVRSLTYIFFVAKGLLVVLPEMCSLSSFEHLGYVTSGIQFDIADYKYLFIGLGLILSTIIGILWLVNIIPYFRRIGAETDFLKRILVDYDSEITNNIGFVCRRALRGATSLFIAGFFFFPNMWIDEINIIPTFIGAILITVGFVNLKKLTLRSKWSIRSGVIFIVASVASYAVSLLFSIYYGIESVTRDFGAYEFYNVTRILSLIEYAAMAFCIYRVCAELRGLIASYLSPAKDITDSRLIDIYSDQQHRADAGVVGGLIGFALAAVVNISYIFARADISAAFWSIPFIALIAWILYMISMLNRLYDQVEYKYI